MVRLTVKDIIQAKCEAVCEKLMDLLDRYENESLPMVGLDLDSAKCHDADPNREHRQRLRSGIAW
jgi:hypothetical protein